MSKKEYDGVSVCSYKVKGNFYKRIQVFWADLDGNRNRTVISLGNIKSLNPEFENKAREACLKFRKEYEKAKNKGEDYTLAHEAALKRQIRQIKTECFSRIGDR